MDFIPITLTAYYKIKKKKKIVGNNRKYTKTHEVIFGFFRETVFSRIITYIIALGINQNRKVER